MSSPSGQRVFIRPNQYEPGRANIVVYNWDKASSVSVDLSEVLGIGSGYRIMHVYDFFGAPVVEGTYDGQPVEIPMRPMKAPRPVGSGMGQCVTDPGDGDTWCFKEPTTLPNTFGAFVVLNNGCVNVPPDNPPQPAAKAISATRTTTAVVVDGELDECAWDVAQQITFLTKQKSSDNEVGFSVLWDDEGLYLRAVVVDDALESDADLLYQDDGLELYFDVNHNRSQSLESDDRQFKINILSEVSNAMLGGAVKKTSLGYTMEVRIPWGHWGFHPPMGCLWAFWSATMIAIRGRAFSLIGWI
ncbi:MAG: sugar-binding protein [Myxococcota bacterium]